MRALPSLLHVFGILAFIAAAPPPSPSSDARTWIASACTAPAGALLVRPRGSYVSGYFGTLVADALVRSGSKPEVARAWMEWYLGHAHDSGSGIDGVPDDVDIVNGEERSRGRPDSTDAYGAVFLSLARHAFESGNPELRGFVLRHHDDLVRIMNSSIATMQPNGLTYARPQYEMYYTIDNVEVLRGLSDAASLFDRGFHDVRNAARYEKYSRIVAHGLDTVLWDTKTQSYRPYMNAAGTSGSANLSQPYPDALANVLAVYYGAVNPEGPMAASLVARAAPALLDDPEPLAEHRLVVLATQQRLGMPVVLPPFTPPQLCVEAAWYLVIESRYK